MQRHCQLVSYHKADKSGASAAARLRDNFVARM